MKRLILILTLLAAPLWAVTPDEILDDPVLEKRARSISAALRCVVCRGESIDESNADMARDMRLLVRELLVAGRSDREVMDFMVERYGEWVLMRPTTDGINKLLWASGPALLLLALGVAGFWMRARRKAAGPGIQGLSSDERSRLDELLKG